MVREVTSAGPATEQLTISLLVDDSQAAADAIQFMRDAIPAFVQRLDGKAEIAIATIGERPTNQIDYTTSTDALKKVIGRLFQKTGSGAYLLEGIVEVSRGLQKREAKRPHIVAISTEGPRVQQSLPSAGARCALRKRSVPPRPRARPALGLDGR
mgnify:CR=1 FL=1